MNVLAEDGAAWRREFAVRARPFSVRWRRARLGSRVLATLWLPLLGLVALLALQQLTLLDAPGGPDGFMVPVALWLGLLGASYLLDRPPLPRLARILDDHLGLEERLATALALAAGRRAAGTRLVQRQRVDALNWLEERGGDNARNFRPRVRRSRVALALAGGLLVAGALLQNLPSPVAHARAERGALQAAAVSVADHLASLRRDTVRRPELPPASRDLLAAQLAAAESALRGHPPDRAAAVAALSQSAERLRGLLPDTFAQASAARRAAARELAAALGPLAADNPVDGNDLDRAAAAAEQALEQIVQAGRSSATTSLALAGSLDHAARTLDATDPALAATLRQTAAALRQNPGASAALRDLETALVAAAQEQTGQDLLASAVAQLQDSKQQIAEAGLPAAAAASPGGAPAALGRLGRAGDGAAARGAPPAAAGTPPARGGGSGAGTGLAAPGQGGPASSAAPPASGSAPGGGAPGTNRVSGSLQGSSGTKNGSAGQAGQGDGRTAAGSGGSGQAGSGPVDSVYVPQGALAAGADTGPRGRVPGVLSPGGNEESVVVRTSAGYNPGVKTPYSRVIGQYRDAAAQALDHSVVPPDAKQYVRDYFDAIAAASAPQSGP